jgi:glutathione peroxidase
MTKIMMTTMMKKTCLVGLVVVVGLMAAGMRAEARSPLAGEMKAIDGSAVNLADYKGKVVLVVNVASRCGYTGQYAGLQKLYDDHKDQGFVILGFPANDFGAQEPGTDAQIAEFCSSKYGVTFPMFAKITVKGAGKPALYEVLTESADPPGEIGWNFEKFLIGKDGNVVGRFKSGVGPADAKLVAAIEQELSRN